MFLENIPSLFLLLSADTLNAAPQQGMTSLIITALFMIGLMYLLIWRPEQKRRKTMESMRTQLKTGDRIVAMGIIGTVYSIKEDSVILRMYDGSKIEMLKAAISDTDRSKDAAEPEVALKEVSSKKEKKEDSTVTINV